MPIAFPDICPQRFEWGQDSPTLRSPSLANGSERVIARAGARWTALIGYDALPPEPTRIMRGFLARLRGGAETALIGPMMQRQPAGTLRGAPVVNGGGQLGTALSLRNCQPGRTLLVGDYIEVAGQIHVVWAFAIANTAGLTTVAIEPPRRYAPNDGALVVWDRPTVPMRLTSARWAQKFGPPLRSGWSGGLELEFVESWI